jgi:hypothetical protein
MPRKTLLNKEQLSEIIRRYQSGERIVDLSVEFKVSKGVIYYQLGTHGISKDANFRNLSPEEIAEVQRLYQTKLLPP